MIILWHIIFMEDIFDTREMFIYVSNLFFKVHYRMKCISKQGFRHIRTLQLNRRIKDYFDFSFKHKFNLIKSQKKISFTVLEEVVK